MEPPWTCYFPSSCQQVNSRAHRANMWYCSVSFPPNVTHLMRRKVGWSSPVEEQGILHHVFSVVSAVLSSVLPTFAQLLSVDGGCTGMNMESNLFVGLGARTLHFGLLPRAGGPGGRGPCCGLFQGARPLPPHLEGLSSG